MIKKIQKTFCKQTKKNLYFLLFAFYPLFFYPTGCGSEQRILVNFAHLEFLSETISFQGDSVGIVHIYSEFPDYKWVDAQSEGIACVDDVSRAAVLRLRHFEITGDLNSLRWSRLYLKFILKMQSEDGEFYNFITSDYKINKTGKTSFKSFNWWAFRGYWALAEGYRIFQSRDDNFAKILQTGFLKCKEPLKIVLQNYPKTKIIDEKKYPTWLPHQYAADQTAVLIQAIVSYLKLQADVYLESSVKLLAEGLLLMQVNTDAKYLKAFLSFPNLWHAWGNSQTIAINKLGALFNNKTVLSSAYQEVSQFYPIILLMDGLAEFRLNEKTQLKFPQIAYGIRCISLGALSSFQTGQDSTYAQLAGLFGSWFLGNNATGKAMYSPESGRGFDGIINQTNINKNAGAESTIETLMTIQELENNPIAKPFLLAKRIKTGEKYVDKNQGSIRYQIYQLGNNMRYYFVYLANNKSFDILSEEEWEKMIENDV